MLNILACCFAIIKRRPLLQTGLLGLLLILVACGPSVPAPIQGTPSIEDVSGSVELATSVPVEPAPEEGYPPPAATTEPTPVDESYPAPERPPASPTPEVYPPSEQEEVFQEPRFRFDMPLVAGITEVTGQAPPNLALAIVDVTFNGEPLGFGRSTTDGTFQINVAALPEGHLIGITFAELEEGLDMGGMSLKYFPHRGEGFLNLPNVGIMLDTASVEP